MSVEREKIERALRDERNVTEAANALGSSRRTLQNRMREYGIPPRRAGRPKRRLPYKRGRVSVAAVGVVGVAAVIGFALLRTKAPTV